MAGYIGSRASVVSSGAERKKTFDITGTTTSLTGLSYTVNQVHVFHNGVRLVDGTDFTATNGSSITLTSAAESGDEVVVISYATFQAADAYTKAETYTKAEADAEFVNDPNGVLNISASASSDALTLGADNTLSVAGKIDAKTAPWVDFSGQIQFGQTGFVANYSGGSNVQTLVGNNAYYNGGYRSIQAGTKAVFMNAASGEFSFNNAPATTNAGDALAMTELMKIDGEGRVTMPYQPAFVAYNAPVYLTNNVNIIWSSTALNRGSVYNTSNGRFTAPVAGLYQFSASVRIENAEPAATYHRVSFRVNGNDITWSKSRLNARTTTGYYSHAASDQLIGCQAGDYVEVKFESGGVAQFTASSNDEHVFYGYLIG